jgi:hypothetical protein
MTTRCYFSQPSGGGLILCASGGALVSMGIFAAPGREPLPTDVPCVALVCSGAFVPPWDGVPSGPAMMLSFV